MSTTEIFLIAMAIIFSVPYLVWRLTDIDYYAPLVVVQIIAATLRRTPRRPTSTNRRQRSTRSLCRRSRPRSRRILHIILDLVLIAILGALADR